MKRYIKVSTVLLAMGMLLTGCGQTGKQNDIENVAIVGSTAMQPMVEMAAEQYQRSHFDVRITVQGGGSGTGLSQVQSGAVTIGNSDIFAQQQAGIDADKLVDHKLAVVGMAPVINKKAGVKELTMAQLRGIFTGKYTNWKQVGGKDLEIILINRAQGSGTRASFEQSVMAGQKAAKSQEQDSNGTVQKMVAATPGAISYLSFSYLTDSIIAPKIDGVKPTEKNVTTNKWKIWSYEHMYTKGKPSKKVQAFINYMQTSKKIQQKLVRALGYIPVQDMKVQKDAHGNVTQIN